jgi:hypothetical protein
MPPRGDPMAKKKLDAPVVQQTEPNVRVPAEDAPPQRTNAGAWAYFVGLLLALFAVLFIDSIYNYYVYAALAILGFIVGLANITDREVLVFLVASVAFVVSANSVRDVLGGSPVVEQLLANVIIFTAASAFIVSIKAIVKTAKDA